MILRILKSNQPVNFVLFPLLALLVWVNDIFHPKSYAFYLGENANPLFWPIYKWLENYPLTQDIIALILLILAAFLVLHINGKYSFIRIRTMLPATLFVLINSGFTQMHALHPVYFAALFLLLSLNRLFSIFEKSKPYSAVFDAGFLLALGSLFYFNLVVLFPALLIGILILKHDYNWREFIISFIGFLTPFIIALGISFLRENLLEQLKVFEQNILTPVNHFKTNVPLHIYLGFLVFLTGLGSYKILEQYDTKKVSTRKYFTILFVFFVFSLLGFVFVPATSHEMLIITSIPVTFLVSNFLVFIRSRFWSEFVFTLIIVMVILMQVIPFFYDKI